jgi:hypothetical protein
MSTLIARKAIRHLCPHANDTGLSFQHTHGNGAPKRKKCAYCGGVLYTITGLWGVFTWRGDGRYFHDGAHETFASEVKADAYATTNDTYVVRWLPDRV